jgi:hypothetical protein
MTARRQAGTASPAADWTAEVVATARQELARARSARGRELTVEEWAAET